MKKRKGFTLAEVLITLGIIGVIAAMTIPTLIQNTNSTKFATQFKKTLSTLSQAALMGQAQYDTDFSMTRTLCGATSGTTAAEESLGNGNLSFCGLFNSTLAGKTYYESYASLKTKKGDAAYSWSDMKALKDKGLENFHIYTLADGSIFGFDKEAKACSIEPGDVLDNSYLKNGKAAVAADPSKGIEAKDAEKGGDLNKCIGFIDVNGTNPPNVEVSCSSGSNDLDATTTCSVNTSGSGLGDIFPIVFHDGTVEPASPAAKTILLQGK